jgi:large subunit ribosomal protein L3
MALGLIGTKVGMTRIFREVERDGASVAVSVIKVGGNRVAQIKDAAGDGYAAVQVAFGERKMTRISKPLAGHLAKYKVGAARLLREFRINAAPADLESGAELSAEMFSPGQKVDVAGTSKGRGFAGVIKRHHFRSGRASHGNSRAERKPGSSGQCQDPGRVFPGKKMAGRMGGRRRTAQNLEIVRVDAQRQLLLIKGAVPGARGGAVIVTPAVKAAEAKAAK